MATDLRCSSKKHGVLLTPATGGIVEVKCNSRFCGAGNGVVVLHQFSTETGELTETSKFKEPTSRKEVK